MEQRQRYETSQSTRDFRIVFEFREKLHKTEELIAKLAHSLKEIQAQKKK